jgi:hypothetical protein
MGSWLATVHPVYLPLDQNKIVYHDNRRLEDLPSRFEHGTINSISKFIHECKHSKTEFVFFSYRFVQGCVLGAVLGLALHPLSKHSPYVYRKLVMGFRSTDLFPLDHVKLYSRTVVPFYALLGGITLTAGTFLSELYDRSISSSKITKYTVLGAIELGLLTALVGPAGSWTNGVLAGLIFGPSWCCFKAYKSSYTQGDYGKSVEYMSHVSEEDKIKHKLQEIRITGINPRN